jgi:hypothetical protein
LNQFQFAARLVCSLCEVMASSLSMTSTAVLSAKVAVVCSNVVGRSAVYSRYDNCPRTLFCGSLVLAGEICVFSFSFYREESAKQIGF